MNPPRPSPGSSTILSPSGPERPAAHEAILSPAGGELERGQARRPLHERRSAGSSVPAGRSSTFTLLLLALLLAACTGRRQSTPIRTATAAALQATQPNAPNATSSLHEAETASATPPPPTSAPTHTVTPSPSATPSPTPCAAPGRLVDHSYPSPTVGGPQNVRAYLPPCYGDDGRAYPALILFGGNIHDETIWDQLGVGEAADDLIAAGEIPPFIIVMPDGGPIANNTSGGPGSYESVILNDLLPWVESNFCVWPDPAGRAIGGLSRGGYWALEIAFRHPHLFASVGGHSAALLDQYAGPAVNPQQTALNNDLGDLRIYLDIGRDDYLRANTIRLHEEMEAAGVPHTWVLQDGRHEEAYWSAHVEEYLRWYAAPWPADRRAYPQCEQP